MTPAPAEPSEDDPLTVIATRKVRPGHEADYEAWLAEIHVASRGFPGYLGAHVVRPGPGAEHEYTNILRFASLGALRAWEASGRRRGWLARLPTHAVDGDARLERREGMELWVTPEATAAPARWRMAIVVIVIVYTLILILSPLVNLAIPTAPFPVRLFASVVVEVFLMTYLVMPRVTRLLERWLFPKRG
jgi:hypothetical protein